MICADARTHRVWMLAVHIPSSFVCFRAVVDGAEVWYVRELGGLLTHKNSGKDGRSCRCEDRRYRDLPGD